MEEVNFFLLFKHHDPSPFVYIFLSDDLVLAKGYMELVLSKETVQRRFRLRDNLFFERNKSSR